MESDKCKVLAMPFRILDKIAIFNPLLAMKMKGGFASCIIHNIRKERPKWLPKPVDPPPATTPIHVKEHAKEHEKEHEKNMKKKKMELVEKKISIICPLKSTIKDLQRNNIIQKTPSS